MLTTKANNSMSGCLLDICKGIFFAYPLLNVVFASTDVDSEIDMKSHLDIRLLFEGPSDVPGF